MRIEDDEVAEIVGLHLRIQDDRASEDACFEAAFESEFWRANPFGIENGGRVMDMMAATAEGDPFPLKVESNQIVSFVGAHVSNLYYRAPQSKLSPPAVQVKPGRKSDLDTPSVEALLDHWMSLKDVKARTTYGFQLALMGGAAAFKVGHREGSADHPLAQVWLDTLPRWECLFDERAREGQESFRGHLRWERIDRARQLLGDELEGIRGARLPDVISASTGIPLDAGRYPDGRTEAGRYVQVLEFYDLHEETLRFYLVDPDSTEGKPADPRCVLVGKPLPLPYQNADGTPAIPIIPIILANHPRFPLRGIPAVRRVYRQNAETNFMLTVVANAMRRDAARMTVYLKKHGMDEDFIRAIQNPTDGEWVGVDSETLDGLWKVLEAPQFAQSLPQYRQWMEAARQDAQGFSDIMTGRQGKYLSATEAELLAGAGESTATEIASRMASALASTCSMFLTVLGEHLGKTAIQVTKGTATHKVTADALLVGWQVEVLDAASTPVRDQQKKVDFLQVVDRLLELVKIAAPLPPVAPAVEGAPPPVPELAPEVRAAAVVVLDYIVTLFQLPDSLKWSALEVAAKRFQPETPPPAAAEPAPETISEEDVRALLAERIGPMVGG
jgi:hypothetical protein